MSATGVVSAKAAAVAMPTRLYSHPDVYLSPAVNGMVEGLHRQLKAFLLSSGDPENWKNHLYLILLGIHLALKSDPDCSTPDVVFGATARLPSEMFSPLPCAAVKDLTNLPNRLQQFMRKIRRLWSPSVIPR
nr:unnamed protein product [Spirometra erinaceieuropaei]